MVAAMIMAIVLPMLMAAAFLLGRHLHRRQYLGEQLSPVSRQHIELFQGGQLNEVQLEAAKSRFRALLERGEVAAVEASLRAGPHFVVQVRALAEIGTEDAGRILRNIRQAMPPAARLLAVEYVLPPGDAPSWGKLLDLDMLVMTGGIERTEVEFRRLYEDAGFALARVVPTPGDMCVIEGVPA